MATRTVTALFDAYEQAAKAVDRVEAEGVPHTDIAIVASGQDCHHASSVGSASAQTPAQGEAAEGAGAGATVGTVLGGGAGLLAGLGLIAIPGIGPVVAAGWLVAAVTGAGVGAATGGLLGALTGAGLSDADAETYAEGVRRGGTLVTVRADDATADRIIDMLHRSGSIDVDERAQGWRAQGWTGVAAQAPQGSDAAKAGSSTFDTTARPTDAAASLADPTAFPETKRLPDEIR